MGDIYLHRANHESGLNFGPPCNYQYTHNHSPYIKVPRQEELKTEVLDMAKKVGTAGFNLLVIDTENKFVSTGFAEEIAKKAQVRIPTPSQANSIQKVLTNTCVLA